MNILCRYLKLRGTQFHFRPLHAAARRPDERSCTRRPPLDDDDDPRRSRSRFSVFFLLLFLLFLLLLFLLFCCCCCCCCCCCVVVLLLFLFLLFIRSNPMPNAPYCVHNYGILTTNYYTLYLDLNGDPRGRKYFSDMTGCSRSISTITHPVVSFHKG